MVENHQDYNRMSLRWDRCRAAAAGEDEIHEGGEKWLPKLSLETDDDYKKRLYMTPYFNATWRTIIALRGLMFRKDPVVSDYDDKLASVDGVSHDEISKRVALECLTVGRCGVLNDHDGIMPTIRIYVAESILNWEQDKLARLFESKNDKGVETHRVLKLDDSGLYMQELYEIKNGKETLIDTIMPMIGGKRFDYIPFTIIGVDSLDWDVEIPPLIDLVNVNMHHYVMSSAYERGCFLSGLPSLFIYGNRDNDKVIYIGSSMANSFPDPQTKAEILEVRGNFGALKENLLSKEMQMAALGAKILEPQKAGVESEGALARRMSGEESVLADMAGTISNGMTKVFYIYLSWLGINDESFTYEINREFLPSRLTSQEISSLFMAWQGGAISYETLFYNYKRASLIPENVDFEEEQDRALNGRNIPSPA